MWKDTQSQPLTFPCTCSNMLKHVNSHIHTTHMHALTHTRKGKKSSGIFIKIYSIGPEPGFP